MWQGFIGKEIQRTNRNLLLTNLGLAGIPVAIGLCGLSYWGGFFGGPKLVSNQDLIAAPSNYMGHYIKIVGADNMETGMQEISQRKSKYTGAVKSETVTARLILLKLNGAKPENTRAILVKLENNDPATNTATGTVESMSSFVEQELKSSPDRDFILPVTVNAKKDFHTPGYIGLAIGLTSGLIGAINLGKWKRRQENINLHPIVKKLSKYGQSEIIAHEIDREFDGQNVIVHKQTKISDSWLIQNQTFGVELKKIVDMIWIYFQVTKHRTNGIPTGKTFAVICHDRDGETVEIPGSEAEVMSLIEQIYAKVPWVIIGHTDEIKLTWEKDRANLISFVDENRQKHEAGIDSDDSPDLHANN
jgi:hypothetical protein